mmetsp:Transcript_32999/g.53540  ORF Transcript_32999/g.53540 Transcript_32999/m.53540 type:complete len:697 (-) Transcript_32999:113-2203(-)|eukprot:CAMPEP_0184665392 /NCGR_PEP_ID=MMETSP0308-20130426/57039_1 /TAXON_ID=38269 /ORGANISM="Gloeochaete witrockiana, Strain SAG 46.84" /LENGTH=696 /DNA_ID=CAMNT_0027109365 /DNA_START=72 /DNA_END=2162 /DNA_ORIENTATION=-
MEGGPSQTGRVVPSGVATVAYLSPPSSNMIPTSPLSALGRLSRNIFQPDEAATKQDDVVGGKRVVFNSNTPPDEAEEEELPTRPSSEIPGVSVKPKSNVRMFVRTSSQLPKAIVEGLLPGIRTVHTQTLIEYITVMHDMMSLLTLIVILLTVVDIELYGLEPFGVGSILLRSFVSLFVWCICVLLARSYLGRLQQMKDSKRVMNAETLYSSGLLWPLLFEEFICALHLPPAVCFTFQARTAGVWNYDLTDPMMLSSVYEYNETILGLSVFLKLYLVLRSVRDHSYVVRGAGRILSSANYVDADVSFVFKSLLDKFPVATLTVIILINLVVTGYCLTVFERAAIAEYIYPDALWNLFIAMTTVGFGDIYPRTYPGRVCVVSAVVVGVVTTALLLAITQKKMQLSTPQRRVINTLDEAALREKYRNAAAKCCQTFWRWHRRNLPCTNPHNGYHMGNRRLSSADVITTPNKRHHRFTNREFSALRHWKAERQRMRVHKDVASVAAAAAAISGGSISLKHEKQLFRSFHAQATELHLGQRDLGHSLELRLADIETAMQAQRLQIEEHMKGIVQMLDSFKAHGRKGAGPSHPPSKSHQPPPPPTPRTLRKLWDVFNATMNSPREAKEAMPIPIPMSPVRIQERQDLGALSLFTSIVQSDDRTRNVVVLDRDGVEGQGGRTDNDDGMVVGVSRPWGEVSTRL